MDTKLGRMLEELDRVETRIQLLDSDIDELEESEIVQELRRKYQILEMLQHELKILREQINGSCNHLWYYMGIENGIPVGICLNCLTKGPIGENEEVFQVLNPTYDDTANKYSFVVLFDELHSTIKEGRSRKPFVRKYQNNINKPIMQMIKDYPY